jgi:hypothetical protein
MILNLERAPAKKGYKKIPKKLRNKQTSNGKKIIVSVPKPISNGQQLNGKQPISNIPRINPNVTSEGTEIPKMWWDPRQQEYEHIFTYSCGGKCGSFKVNTYSPTLTGYITCDFRTEDNSVSGKTGTATIFYPKFYIDNNGETRTFGIDMPYASHTSSFSDSIFVLTNNNGDSFKQNIPLSFIEYNYCSK